MGQNALGLGFDVRKRPGEEPQGRQADRESGGVAVELQRRFDRRKPDFVDAQRPFHRIAVDGGDQSGVCPTMKPAWGPPSSLSPEKVTTSAPSATTSRTVGSLCNSVSREIDQNARSEIVQEGRVGGAGDFRELRSPDLRGKTLDAIVRRVDFQDYAGLGGHRVAVVLRMGAIGRPDLDKPRAGARHDVGHAKSAADLDELAARHDRLAPARQRIEAEQARRRRCC